MELVTLVYFTCTELTARKNSARCLLIRIPLRWRLGAVTHFSSICEVLVDSRAFLDNLWGGEKFMLLRLLLRYFSLVVNWGADVQDRFRTIKYWSTAKRLFKEYHLCLTGLRLQLVRVFDVYHFFLEFFQKLIYSWLVFTGLLSTGTIARELLYNIAEWIVLYGFRVSWTDLTRICLATSCWLQYSQMVTRILGHLWSLLIAFVARVQWYTSHRMVNSSCRSCSSATSMTFSFSARLLSVKIDFPLRVVLVWRTLCLLILFWRLTTMRRSSLGPSSPRDRIWWVFLLLRLILFSLVSLFRGVLILLGPSRLGSWLNFSNNF